MLNFLKVFALEILEAFQQKKIVHLGELELPGLLCVRNGNVVFVGQRDELFEDDELFELGHLFV